MFIGAGAASSFVYIYMCACARCSYNPSSRRLYRVSVLYNLGIVWLPAAVDGPSPSWMEAERKPPSQTRTALYSRGSVIFSHYFEFGRENSNLKNQKWKWSNRDAHYIQKRGKGKIGKKRLYFLFAYLIFDRLRKFNWWWRPAFAYWFVKK